MVTFGQASSPVNSARTLFYLLLASSLQIALVSCQDISAMSGECDRDCGPGYECMNGICKRQDCTRINCSGVADKLVCGSIGDTYSNLCELERARCEYAYNIEELYPGPCITGAPPPAQDCRAHQVSFDNNYADHIENCSLMPEEYANGTFTQSKLDKCYRPHCNAHSEKYLIKQCLPFDFHEWCWCSTLDGQFIEGTFQENMPPDFCSNQRKCVVDGRTHNNGAVFTTPSICGLCECLNGTHNCFVDLDVDSSGRLSNESLDRLKKDLIQVFNFQYNHKDPNIDDIKLVYKHPTEVSENQKNTILDWKFNHLDTDQDKYLNNIEKRYNFLNQQLLAIFGCGRFLDHVCELVDENDDQKITLKEWKDFFHTTGANASGEGESGESSPPVKREAVFVASRKPLHLRKKFYYTLQ